MWLSGDTMVLFGDEVCESNLFVDDDNNDAEVVDLSGRWLYYLCLVIMEFVEKDDGD